jgi:DNA/RNA endonuclease G (NUC1)
MLHALLGFSIGSASVAVLYETVLKGKKQFVPPPPASKLITQQQQQSNTQTTNNIIPSHILPSTTDEIFVAPDNAYISNFSSALRTPRWVLEVFDPEKIWNKSNKKLSSLEQHSGGDRNNSKFFANESIPEQFRADNTDYSVRPGLSRGHLAAAQFHKSSQQEMDATFDLSLNIVPQDMTVNACDWFRLEQMSKALCKEFSKLYVLTGPAFVPTESGPNNSGLVKQIQYEVIGQHQVAVPTHMFKCLLGENSNNSPNSQKYALGCFLMPNKPIRDEKPLAAYQIGPDELEKITGLKLFSEIRKNNSSWYPLCSRHKCEGSYGSFSKNFRQIGVLRSCRSRPELDFEWNRIQKEYDANGQAIDSSLAKEYQTRLKNFA